MDATGKQVVVLPKFGILDPVAGGITGRLGNLELDKSRGFLLHDGGMRRYVFTIRDTRWNRTSVPHAS